MVTWEGTWTWERAMGLEERGTGMWIQVLGMWHSVRTGHNEVRALPWG